MFTTKSESLYDFFNAAGVAYYIPYYQRQYSWDTENIEKMLDDLSDGVKKICEKNDYVRFIGSIILWEEKEAKIGVHYDSNGLITKIYNVIDGQQRISTLAVLAILISKRLSEIKNKIISISENEYYSPVIDVVKNSIDNRILELREMYSTEIKKANVKPKQKPIIIRAFNNLCHPIVDQWTLNGAYFDYYKSDIGKFIAEFIQNNSIDKDIKNIKLKENIKRINLWIKEVEQNDREHFPSIEILLEQNNTNLVGIVDDEISIYDINNLSDELKLIVNGVIRILSVISFLLKKTYLTVIESPSESLAFDMFQSINATGTPLTAIEVFKPQVVNSMGNDYGTSKLKYYFDLADSFFDEQKTSDAKEKLTDELLLRMALVYNGEELGRRFSEQRDWLINSYNKCNTLEEKENFIHWLSDLTEYWKDIFKPRKPNTDSDSFSLINRLVTLGLNSEDADLTALCIFYLKDANHAMAHYVISLFYSKLLRSQNNNDRENACYEFKEICKACAAFFTLWSAAINSGFPDQAYRDLFKKEINISWFSGAENQSSIFVKNHFKKSLADKLDDKKVFNINNIEESRNLWMNSAKSRLGYSINKKVCRFALFLASHDKSPDLETNNQGLMIHSPNGTSKYLTCKKWYSSDYAEIEHIANRTKPKNPKYAIDDNLYPGNSSVVDMIGNLTLLSKPVNAGMYDEWAEKVFYYSTLTSLTPTKPVDLKELALKQGISITPTLSDLAASSNYIVNLAPLALRGNAGLPWDKEFVDRRTERICELVFDDMVAWLGS